MSTTITIEGKAYRVGRLHAFNQFHVVRRLMPIITSMGVTVIELLRKGVDLQNDDSAIIELSEKVLPVLSKMSNEDVDYVLHTCLDVVEREEEAGRWMKVQTGKSLQFADIEMPVMIRLVVEVLKENLGGFFVPSPAGSASP